ncbi:hypothetical protein J437_LFUL007346 [Ladona fulva]|uniref:C2H2-type domain-containing protein n=1 Tax=Ladona fulva TaxID=123851 RepID=A0A8K0P572_LADFU|nr:hypothetical protein J437_LFUL007346 [Ladona fulva]
MPLAMATFGIEVGNPTVLSKIESFLNDSTYREVIENSSNYNTRLCVERRLRMPFLDSQTGVAQNHSNLFMSPRQRIPGLVEGQIYTYPSKRWRKKRRQYLMNFLQPRRKEADPEIDLHTISTVENPAAINEDSKDSTNVKEEPLKFLVTANLFLQFFTQDPWIYDELDIQEVEGYDDPDPDSDYDYEETYSKRKKRRGGKVSRGGGRGRKKANYDALTDAEKPFSCELCGARYKTRPGLTYHYTHSHKDRDEEEDGTASGGGGTGGSPGALGSGAEGGASGGGSGGASTVAAPGGATPSTPKSSRASGDGSTSSTSGEHTPVGATSNAAAGPTRRGRHGSQAAQQQLQTPTTSGGNSGGQTSNSSASGSEEAPPPEKKRRKGGDVGASPATPANSNSTISLAPAEEKERAQPSPYCDFCLGDAAENKKTGRSEELVSCSDCGRSGKRKYRKRKRGGGAARREGASLTRLQGSLAAAASARGRKAKGH